MDKTAAGAVEIIGVKQETPTVRTFTFSRDIGFHPGQFVMVWVPGVDEIPMALSSGSSITVQKVGDATEALFRMKQGDRVGIRGPYGNGFPIAGRILGITGGVGAAPLRPLVATGKVDRVLLGARTKEELLFFEEFGKRARVFTATDDGSDGICGPVTALMPASELLSYDSVCVCGPEKMLAAVLACLDDAGIAERGYFSLHRYMKCGIGLCGSCCIDPSGLRVCREGPVFTGTVLLGSELGKYTRDGSGTKRML